MGHAEALTFSFCQWQTSLERSQDMPLTQCSFPSMKREVDKATATYMLSDSKSVSTVRINDWQLMTLLSMV